MVYGVRMSSVVAAAFVGATPRPVHVDATLQRGKGAFVVVGLPDAAIREACLRVQSAVAASGRRLPGGRIIVNLAPGDLRKEGSGYDLPIALAALQLAGQVPGRSMVAMGELALDGTLRSVRTALAAGVVAARRGIPCLVPSAVAADTAFVTGADVRAVDSLAEAIAVLEADAVPALPVRRPADVAAVPDLAMVRGQLLARRALEVAAAGGHHLLLNGSPGSGKSLLASTLPGILPPLDAEQRLRVALVWAAAGRDLPGGDRPPFRSPHHTASMAALLGGGSGIPVPGEISLAHHGVLFLDEFGEFPAHLLDGLRQPLENGAVHIARKGVSVRFPADVQLIAATNPCPCGFALDRVRSCTCSGGAVERYTRRLSGPLLDRIDVRVRVTASERAELMGAPGEESAAVAARVAVARARQAARGRLNRSLTRDHLDALVVEAAAERLLGRALDTGMLTGRGYDRIRRVARTIADLDGDDTVGESHVAEALTLRGAT